ncbi:MAG: hypothetical protein JWQ22_3316 [Devosia sp.]|nr:hypothetical protein [Devosia sp.]
MPDEVACLAVAVVIAAIGTIVALLSNHEIAGPLVIVQFVLLALMLGAVYAIVTSFRLTCKRRHHGQYEKQSAEMKSSFISV